MRNATTRARIWALAAAIVLCDAGFAQVDDSSIPAGVFQQLKDVNIDVRIDAFNRLLAVEQDALKKNRPVPPKVSRALIALLQFEETTAANDESTDDEYMPELIRSVAALHDPKTMDLLLNPSILGTLLVTDDLASYGDSIVPKLLATYDLPPQIYPNYDDTKAVRFDVMTVMVGMMEKGTIKNKNYSNRFKSIFIANTQLNGPHDSASRALAVRGLAYLNDPEARRQAQDALNDPSPEVRREAASAIKAQNKLLGFQ